MNKRFPKGYCDPGAEGAVERTCQDCGNIFHYRKVQKLLGSITVKRCGSCWYENDRVRHLKEKEGYLERRRNVWHAERQSRKEINAENAEANKNLREYVKKGEVTSIMDRERLIERWGRS